MAHNFPASFEDYLNNLAVSNTMRKRVKEIYFDLYDNWGVTKIEEIFLNEESVEDYNIVGFFTATEVFSCVLSEDQITAIPLKSRIVEFKLNHDDFTEGQVTNGSNIDIVLKVGSKGYWMSAYRRNCLQLKKIIKSIIIPNLANKLL